MENRSFYNEILTEHNLHPEFKHDLPDTDIVLEGVNPSCGDDIFLKLKLDGDTIADGAFVGDGCAISQASADQRAGRSGRTAPGVCIRLYSEADFESRPRYTDPEVLRTNLAAVILQMAALQLGEVESFPFLDPPDARSVRDGVQLLQELGAFDRSGALTDVGRRLAQLPVDLKERSRAFIIEIVVY